VTPVRSYEELVRRQAEAAVAISGAHHSSWNGDVDPLTADERAEGVQGLAFWDGSIAYNDEKVVEPLREMFVRAGRQQDPATLLRYRDALRVVLHENSHLLATHRSSWSDGEHEYQTPAGKALEEGVTEGWSFAHLNDYIDELGLERIAPGIKAVEGRRAYPQYNPAVKELCDGIGAAASMDGDEVLRRLNVVHPRDKWRVAVDLLWQSSELPNWFHGVDAMRMKADILSDLRKEFDKLAALTPRTYSDQAIESSQIGKRAVAAATDRVRKLEAVMPPAFGARPGPDLMRRAAASEGPARHRGDPDRPGGARSQAYDEAARAIALGTGTAPLHSARPPEPGLHDQPPKQPRRGAARDPGQQRD
jgi:hypothetical protein